MRAALWTVVGVIVLAWLGWGGVAVYRHRVYGTVFTESSLSVTVEVGDRFSLAVPDRGGSVGDLWSAQPAAGEILDERGHRMRKSSLLDQIRGPAPGGGQGTSFFLYEARAAGTTEVTLSNCFQGCDQPTPSSESRDVTWTITVR